MHRAYSCLLVLVLAYVCNQWSRYSIVYLGSVATPECGRASSSDACYFEKGKEETPLCPSYKCNKYTAECTRCQKCLNDHDADHKNLQYGTCINSAEYGVLNSFGYAISFSFCNLIAGRAADIYNRKMIVAVAAIAWAVATLAQGLSKDFTELLFVRIFMGAAQAFSTPASYSLIADLFSVENRAFANGIFSLGVYVGGGLSSLSLLLATGIGWRQTSYAIAICSFAIGLATMVVTKEPRNAGSKVQGVEASETDNDINQQERLLSDNENTNTTEGGYDAIESARGREELENAVGNDTAAVAAQHQKKATLKQAARMVFSDSCVCFIFIASGLRFFGGFAIASFLPIFFKRKYPNENVLYGTLNALVVSVGGALSATLGGWVTDKYSQVFDERVKVWIPAVAFVLGFGPFFVVLFADNFYLSITALFFEYVLAECWFGPVIAILQNRIPAEARGITISVFLFIASMVGNISPLLIGHLDDGETVKSVRSNLFYLVGLSYVGSAVIFAIAGTRMR